MNKVLIAGGGAAGMMAAVMAAREGCAVTLFEKNEKLGKKVFITGKENDYGKFSLIGVDYDIIHDQELKEETEKLRLVVNARAVCESDLLLDIVDDAFDAVAEKYNVKIKVFFSECFGMMDEGRH